MLNIATRHASGKEAVGAVFVQGDGKAPLKAVGKGAKWSAKGSNRGPKWQPQ
jgi:hypothetical protein